ncbi:MAG: nucleotidyltransferase domain-containing protein [Candidatus Aenigmatarchaeota archaeon]|nr:nucleotidyltransferase domain-containing protein [Candidatus Aenigmarchaeota archaeon]
MGRRVAVGILVFFLENPTSHYSETDVRIKLKLARANTNMRLRILFNLKLLNKITRGRMDLYKLNLDSPVAKQFKILINLSKLFQTISKLENVRVFLYGSTARGEDVEESDIDLLIIGKQSKEIIED